MQLLFGLALMLIGRRPGQWEHALYGLAAAVSLPAVHLYTRGHPERGRRLFFALASVWLVALTVRGITTGR